MGGGDGGGGGELQDQNTCSLEVGRYPVVVADPHPRGPHQQIVTISPSSTRVGASGRGKGDKGNKTARSTRLELT